MPGRPMGATCLTLPSCPPTWARSVVLTNSACRSWVNGSSPVVRCWPGGSSNRRVRPVVCRCGCQAAPRDSVTRRLAHEPLGWRPTTLLITSAAIAAPAVGMCRARTPAGAAEPRPKAVASRAAMGARRHRVSALDRRSGRRGPRRVVEHRERRGAGRAQACVDRGPTPVRRCARDRRRRALLAPHPPRR